MNEAYVTLQGWVGGDVEIRRAGDARLAVFRVATTPRYQRGGEWVDGQTSWYTVQCWRGLGANVAESVHKGDPVVVHGRVRVDVWERDDHARTTSWIVDASFVGHDLGRGISRFERVRPTEAARGGTAEGSGVATSAEQSAWSAEADPPSPTDPEPALAPSTGSAAA